MRLLAAIDLNDHARDVVDEVIRWTAALHGVVDLAYVDEYGRTAALVPDPQVRIVVEEQWEKIREHNAAVLEALVATLPERVRGEARYLTGRAATELARVGADYDALLIATHGRTGLGHALLGSVAERVLRHAPCPVIVLRLPRE